MMYDLSYYKKFLMNRTTITPAIIEYIENSVITEDEVAKHSFHRIMVHNWTETDEQLFDVLSDYFGASFIPVNFSSQSVLTTFYTSSLNFVLKVIKLDFMFPFCRNMFNLSILFNDKTSMECFDEKITVEDVVTGVVSFRFNENFELNLSNFSNDPEFTRRKIHFYKLPLLSYFKILMIRMGRDTKTLNLSNNNLSLIPLEILNFFIKGDLIGVNLSNNNIPSFSELHRVSSKIERLWVEGNPLCEDIDAVTYIKQIVKKFPRLTEIDGVPLTEYGIMLPFYRNFLITPDRKTKMIVEKFLTLYFAHYDVGNRRKIDMFYDPRAVFTISTSFTEAEEKSPSFSKYTNNSRNMLDPVKRDIMLNGRKNREYVSRNTIATIHSQLPEVLHDPSSFTIDVIKNDSKFLMFILDGVFKDVQTKHIFQFRRTFVLSIYSVNTMSHYNIVREMFSISRASEEMVHNSFKIPVRHLNQLTLINPDAEDKETICRIFTHCSQLRKSEAEKRLQCVDWDLRRAIKAFTTDLKNNEIAQDHFLDVDDFSDSSSLLDDEID